MRNRRTDGHQRAEQHTAKRRASPADGLEQHPTMTATLGNRMSTVIERLAGLTRVCCQCVGPERPRSRYAMLLARSEGCDQAGQDIQHAKQPSNRHDGSLSTNA
jgi:hypothetical protein